MKPELVEKFLLTKAERSKANWLKLAIMLGVDCGMRRGGDH